MAFHKYQVTFNEAGHIEKSVQLPDEEDPRKRTIIVREETLNRAKRAAEQLYSLAT